MNKKHGSNVPLVLMNSFNTHSDTERIRFKYERRVDLHMFQQSYYPRVLKETLRPYPEKIDLQDGRYGRGRGRERREGFYDYCDLNRVHSVLFSCSQHRYEWKGQGSLSFNITLPGLVIFVEWQLALNLINIGMVY